MRAFLILCSVICIAQAANLGYNYQSNGGSGVPGVVAGVGGVVGGDSYSSNGDGLISGGQGGGQFGGDVPVFVAGGGPSYSSNGGGLISGGQGGGQIGGDVPVFVAGGGGGPSYSSNGGGLISGGQGGGQIGGDVPVFLAGGGPSYSSSGLPIGNGGQAGGKIGGEQGGGSLSLGPTQIQAGQSAPSYNDPAAAAPVAPTAEVNKQFYSYSAPDYAFNDIGDVSPAAQSLKKSLRVIFIKGPERSGLENAALNLAKAASEDRTVIYVLNKQSDVGDLANRLQSLDNRHSNKPEVHFVKYRTPTDLESAQRAIQSQYDSLEGPTTSHNGGVAPVLDYVAKEPAAGAGQQADAPVGGANVESSYLPPNKGVEGSYLPPNKRV